MPGAPVQFGTRIVGPPFSVLKIWIDAGVCPDTIDSSRVKTITSGLAAVVAASEVISTCWPRSWKPVGAGTVIAVSAIVTLPPPAVAGTPTEVSTASVAVGPVPAVSVVTLPPAEDTVPEAASGAGLPAFGVTALDGSEGGLEPYPLRVTTVTVIVWSLYRPVRAASVSLPGTLKMYPSGHSVTTYSRTGSASASRSEE